MSKIAGELNAEIMKKVIHDRRAKLFAEIVAKTGSKQSVIDRAMQEIESLREQVEKLTEELSVLKTTPPHLRQDLHCVASDLSAQVRERDEQLTALAEQNAKMRKALTKWRYLDSSYNWRCGHCGNEVEDGHKEDCALSLPNLATPALNRIKAEAYLEVVELVEAHHTWTTNVAAGKLLRTKADELGKEA